MPAVVSPPESSPVQEGFFCVLASLFPLLKSYQNMILEYDFGVSDKSY